MADDTAAPARRLVACLDLTELKDDCTSADVERLLSRASNPGGHVAAVCVWPAFVAQSVRALEGGRTLVATVVNFPHGSESFAEGLKDTARAVLDGADEIDMVISYRRASDVALVERQVRAFVEAAQGRTLKAILETGEIGDPDRIRAASDAAIAGGADFIKTSTGKTKTGATLDAARIMLQAIKASGREVGLKPSGGVRTLAEAKAYLDLCDEIMGAGWADPSCFRIGASSLLDDLLRHIDRDAAAAGPSQGY